MFWVPDAPIETMKIRGRLFAAIATKTSWRMSVMAPIQAESVLAAAFNQSPWGDPVLFNTTAVLDSLSVSKYLYDHNLGMPPIQNVLVACIYIALRMGHKDIVLLGADHSWHESLALDDQNRVCLKDRHFYDKEASLSPFTMDGSPDKIFTMDKLFHALGRMFEGYWSLARYSRSLNAFICNASSTTYIDAFPRTQLETALKTSPIR